MESILIATCIFNCIELACVLALLLADKNDKRPRG